MENKSNILGVEIRNYGECGFCRSEPQEKLTIPWEIWSEWLHINFLMKDREWGCVFWVVEKDGTPTVDRYEIPKQEVTGTECLFREELGGNGIMHYHHGMGAFHSGQDDKHCRNLYDYSIVLSTSDCVATRKMQLPCKGYGYAPCIVYLSGHTVNTGKIEEKSAVAVFSGSGGNINREETVALQRSLLDELEYMTDDEELEMLEYLQNKYGLPYGDTKRE